MQEWSEPIRAAFGDKVSAMVQVSTDDLPDAQPGVGARSAIFSIRVRQRGEAGSSFPPAISSPTCWRSCSISRKPEKQSGRA